MTAIILLGTYVLLHPNRIVLMKRVWNRTVGALWGKSLGSQKCFYLLWVWALCWYCENMSQLLAPAQALSWTRPFPWVLARSLPFCNFSPLLYKRSGAFEQSHYTDKHCSKETQTMYWMYPNTSQGGLHFQTQHCGKALNLWAGYCELLESRVHF